MSGALACTIGFERGDVSIDGGPPQAMTLRTTHVYRYTRARWHLVHRHADFPPADQRVQGPGPLENQGERRRLPSR
jgi:ketosteroid isomerase-like protein